MERGAFLRLVCTPCIAFGYAAQPISWTSTARFSKAMQIDWTRRPVLSGRRDQRQGLQFGTLPARVADRPNKQVGHRRRS